MKKSKWLALAGVALLGVGVLAACSSKSNTSGTTYGYVYSSDPETLDYITSNTGPTKSFILPMAYALRYVIFQLDYLYGALMLITGILFIVDKISNDW